MGLINLALSIRQLERVTQGEQPNGSRVFLPLERVTQGEQPNGSRVFLPR
jgi:hypothetical protein